MRERILEVQEDFFFLGLVENKFKMIVFRQVFSGLLGVTAVSKNFQVTGQHVFLLSLDFLKHLMGLQSTSGRTPRAKSESP